MGKIPPPQIFPPAWWRGPCKAMINIVGLINEVNQRRARLVLGWVTVFGRTDKPFGYVSSQLGQLTFRGQ